MSFFSPLACLPRCTLCLATVRTGRAFCDDCLVDLPWRTGPYRLEDNFLVWGSFWYDPPVSWLIHEAKFQKKAAICWHLGRLMASRPEPFHTLTPIVCPIPLPWQRQLQRGYNQSLLLGGALAHDLGWSLEPEWLVRKGYRASQRGLSRVGRLALDPGVFAANKAVEGRKILLVDDVCTTGATLSAARQRLLAQGAEEVFAWVCAVVR